MSQKTDYIDRWLKKKSPSINKMDHPWMKEKTRFSEEAELRKVKDKKKENHG